MPGFSDGRASAALEGSGPLTPGARSGAVESAEAALAIRVLGPFEVRVGGERVAMSGGKRDALLAVLALAGERVVGVEQLIDAVWDDDLPAAPRNAVQHHVARLRVALGQDEIVSSPDGYALNDAWVDALRFEELLSQARVSLREGDARSAADAAALALGLWVGPALQGLTDTSWLRSAARRLEALRLDALEERFEAALALGQHRELLSGLRTTLDENPFRERLWAQLMLALYRAGRQADALEAYQEARRVLGNELGLEPGPQLRGLQEAILAHDPAIAPVPIAPRRQGNLPAASSSFVDREHELGRVFGLLGEHRLVTLVGPPGVGKTRLALEAARSLEDELRDGGWLAELARAGGAVDVARLVADALDARGGDPLAEVLARLRDADAIVVFDACEHWLPEAAQVVAAVLAGCPRVRVLATSRAPLRVAGEVRVLVGPLPLGEPESAGGESSPAVQLFAARASAARPGFELTDQATPLAAEIARRADGLPLAIELAAAQVGAHGLAEVLAVVKGRVALLRDRAAPDPLRTALRELVDWSYEQLHADEQAVLHLIAVHRGGASLPGLVALGRNDGLDEATVTHLVGALVDKSIVSVAFPGEEARYDLLDTVRDYALERLAEADRLGAVRQAHAEYFATLAEGARTGLRGRDWSAWAKRLGREHHNLWAALTHARDAHDPDIAIRLGGSLGLYFVLAERVSEGREYLRLALAASSEEAPVGLRVELLGWLCFFALDELDVDAAIEAGERAIALSGDDPLRPESARARIMLALALRGAGDKERTARLCEQAIEASASGDDATAAMVLVPAALVAVARGDVSTAGVLAAEALRYAEAIDFQISLQAAKLIEAWVAEQRDDEDAAVRAYMRVLTAAEQPIFANNPAFALARLGRIAVAAGRILKSEELFRRALTAADAARAPWVTAYARVGLARARAAAGDADAAERLYRQALETALAPRPHRSRESLYALIAGSPAAGALLGLAELAEARGDTSDAEALRARAATQRG